MAGTINDLLNAAQARLDRVDAAGLPNAVLEGAVVIDTRCGDARRRTGTIPGAIHIPLSVLYWRLDPASGHQDPAVAGRDRRIVLYCADGFSSSLAAVTLQDLGFAGATDLIGGFNAWAAAGMPVEAVPDRSAERRA